MQQHPEPDMDERAGVLDRRAEAFLLDAIFVAFLAGVLGYAGGHLVANGPMAGLGGVILGIQLGGPVLLLAYHVAFEGHYGQTPGKFLRDIVVVDEDGSDVSWVGAVARNVLRVVDVLPVFYVVGIVVAYLTDKHQRVGDLAASTVVVHTAD